jgi:hypothetical protein
MFFLRLLLTLLPARLKIFPGEANVVVYRDVDYEADREARVMVQNRNRQ